MRAKAKKATRTSAATSRTDAAQPTTDPPPTAVRGPDSRPESPVHVRGLVKRFGRFRALDHLDLEVEAGSVHGFLGPNGAGKSTTIRVLLGLYRPNEGSVSVLGREPWRDAALINRQVSYVPGDVALWPALTGGQVLDALAGLRGSRAPIGRPSSSSGSNSIRPSGYGPTPRGIVKRWRSWPPWQHRQGCSCSTSPPAAWILSWSGSSPRRSPGPPARAARFCSPAISWPRSNACAAR